MAIVHARRAYESGAGPADTEQTHKANTHRLQPYRNYFGYRSWERFGTRAKYMPKRLLEQGAEEGAGDNLDVPSGILRPGPTLGNRITCRWSARYRRCQRVTCLSQCCRNGRSGIRDLSNPQKRAVTGFFDSIPIPRQGRSALSLQQNHIQPLEV
ncbi:hypothetical protein BO99DRAFT_211769 [Aspergillus violaceofuscus CBS 115571]|uniref:Uncharacterized protein n=1 Tax=Aspergillus violaceofuscus (strain CBS 115571) TaxID=1450538 RepID=A0A2V5H4E9_ASPV1|nr:hypothetical protein BO99DRAFT_211769 [Aspergillus violaceofuscus CBS 115571]